MLFAYYYMRYKFFVLKRICFYPIAFNPVTLSSRTLSTFRSLCYPVSSRTLSTSCSFCYPVSFRILSTIRSLCYFVFSYHVYRLFTLLPCLLSTLSSVNTVTTTVFSQNEVSCHSCQPWSSLNSLVHREVTRNVKCDSK